MQSPQEWLQKIQSEYLPFENPDLINSEHPSILATYLRFNNGKLNKDKFDEYSKWIKTIIDQAPSKYEEPFLYNVMKNALDNMIATAKLIDFPVIEDIYIGNLYSGEINAGAKKLNTGNIITINYGMHLLLLSLSFVVFSFFKSMAADDTVVSARREYIKEALQDKSHIGHLLFGESLAKYALIKDARFNPNLILSPNLHNHQLAVSIYEIAIQFIIAHEYAHLIIKKTDEDYPNIKTKRKYSVSTELLYESSADYMAFLITMACRIKNGFDIPMTYGGIEFALSCMKLAEQTRAIPTNKQTHLTSTLRKKLLRRYLADYSPNKQKVALILAKNIQYILNYLWKCHQEMIKEIVKEGRDKFGL